MRKKNQTRHIEFVGLPTSGKTTVYTEVTKNLQTKNINARCIIEPEQKINRWHFIFLSPLVLYQSFLSLLFYTYFVLRYTQIHSFNIRILFVGFYRLRLIEAYKKIPNPEIFLSDGVLHFLPTLYFKKTSNLEEVVKKFLEFELKRNNAKIIYIDIDKDTYIQRLRKRIESAPLSTLAKMSPKEQQDFIDRTYRQMQTLKTVIQDVDDALTLNAEADVSEKVIEVIHYIQHD